MSIDSNMITALGVILFGVWEATKWMITRKDTREQKERDAVAAALLLKTATGVDGMQSAAREVAKLQAERADAERKASAASAERASDKAAAERKAATEAAERANTAALAAAGRTTAAADRPGNTIVENVEQLQAGRMSVADGRRTATKKRPAPKRRKAR